MTGPRILLCHPGAQWSTHDVFVGLHDGLIANGVTPYVYRLDARLESAKKTLHVMWRQGRKKNPDVPKPTLADQFYQASVGALERALRWNVDVVLVVSAMYFHPDVITLMRRAGLKVCVLFTETPYDLELELPIAKMVNGGWTHERSCVEIFKRVNPNMGYLPHGWHPTNHRPDAPMADVAPHDVVFVGSGFAERMSWFNAIDWTGIDLGLYGPGWGDSGFGLKDSLKSSVKATAVDNRVASALYRSAKVGLNLYRSRNRDRRPVSGDSLSPRAYELAACGAFHISDYRAEVPETFGDLVPTFRTPHEAEALMRHWLADDAGRARIAAQLPACVAEASWISRAQTVLGDLETLLAADMAA